MKKHRVRNAVGWSVILALGLCSAWAVGQQHFGSRQQPQAHEGPEWHEFNVHDHGIGLRLRRDIPIPGLPGPLILRVVDLGPDVFDMKADIEPVAASAWVDGNGPFVFEPVTSGVLEVSVPRRLLDVLGPTEVSIQVWGPGGQSIVDVTGELPPGL